MGVVVRKKSGQQIRKEAKLKKTEKQLEDKTMSAAKRKRKTTKLADTKKQIKTARSGKVIAGNKRAIKKADKTIKKAVRTKKKEDRVDARTRRTIARKTTSASKAAGDMGTVKSGSRKEARKGRKMVKKVGQRKKLEATKSGKRIAAAESTMQEKQNLLKDNPIAKRAAAKTKPKTKAKVKKKNY